MYHLQPWLTIFALVHSLLRDQTRGVYVRFRAGRRRYWKWKLDCCGSLLFSRWLRAPKASCRWVGTCLVSLGSHISSPPSCYLRICHSPGNWATEAGGLCIRSPMFLSRYLSSFTVRSLKCRCLYCRWGFSHGNLIVLEILSNSAHSLPWSLGNRKPRG